MPSSDGRHARLGQDDARAAPAVDFVGDDAAGSARGEAHKVLEHDPNKIERFEDMLTHKQKASRSVMKELMRRALDTIFSSASCQSFKNKGDFSTFYASVCNTDLLQI